MLITPCVKRLMIANALAFLASATLPAMVEAFALVPVLVLTRPWTLVTYMFLHGGMAHILLNMLMLLCFGPRLEERLGSRTFLRFYLGCGIGGAALSIATPYSMIVGASGAIFGVVAGFARYWPRERIYIWGILPVEARVLAILLVGASLYAGFSGSRDGIAHFTHLGGLAAGWLILKGWERRRRAAVVGRSSPRGASAAVEAERMARWVSIGSATLHEVNRREVERLLEKARRMGPRALTREEVEFLDRIARG